ncbi:U3 small nucleolar RNA-associated protein [Wickerhamomyces ciferrii]|uniref:U3 small nucleolar RNA-associated protein n=1 Tax=Wickerhamomyces ciferrii (strain ATCC 14091 / BCRC 22168 / CBS 111 / JCM 3599 / NBRC 0793 / NRRL Y-1031 F-60-10) TaxID=1206466 RepID=K0KC51_WICCF|nr:U3 small nucleolar RNA-associated protein [Wickerhamomyces ciferrii]CCH40471.1 U3 small nucleolar RNA-associated protein [Wickerhamomyces ciferrii]
MSISSGKFDYSARFYATRTSKLGKNEIHIYPLQHNQKNQLISSSSLISSFEIEYEENFVSFDWIQQEESAKSNKRSKRRHSLNGSNHESSNTSSYLAASFKQGKILIYSPFKKEVINEFNIEHKNEITALTSSLSNGFWVACGNEILEYTLNDSKPKNQIILPKSIREITSLNFVHINGQNYMLIGGNKLIIYDLQNDKVLKEFTASKGKNNSINSITIIDEIIAISRSNSSVIQLYSLKDKKELGSIKTSSNISSLKKIGSSSLGLINNNGVIEIYNDLKASKPSFSIKSNHEEIGFTEIISNQDELYISWFDFEPKFKSIKINNQQDDIIIDVEHTVKNINKGKKTIEIEDFQNLKADPQLEVREIELAPAIEKQLKQQEEPLTLLLSNPDLNKIKFASSELSPEHAVELFKILKERVELNPSESVVFNNWTKWLLLLHTDSINSSVNIKTLTPAISKSLKQLPDLLSLQGRLEMLQSQIKLRSQLSSAEEAPSVGKNLIEQAEESIVYVNGENDEADDEVIAAGGESIDEDDSEDEQDEDDGEEEEGEEEDTDDK